jgi:hypothetical protein
LSNPRTPSFRNTYRKPARGTLAAAGTTAAAAALAAVGLAAATPAGPGVTSTLGPALTAHDGAGSLPPAQMSLDGRASGRAEGGSPASQLAAGVSPVTATGRTILASGLTAGATLDGTAKHLHRAAPAGQTQAGHRGHQAHRAVRDIHLALVDLRRRAHAGGARGTGRAAQHERGLHRGEARVRG